MSEDKDEVIADLRQTIAVLNGELAVAKAEIKMLEEQRSATRLYLGVGLGPDDDEAPPDDPKWVIVNGVNKIMSDWPGKKIQQIKEVRCDERIAEAFVALGGKIPEGLDAYGNKRVMLGLREAKEIIDSAWETGTVHIPGRMRIKL